MRFTITLRPQTGGWSAAIASSDLQDWTAEARQLLAGAGGYPHPSADEKAHWDNFSAELCTDLKDSIASNLHRRIVVGDPDPHEKEVERFGGYLRAALLGPWWDRIKQDAPNGPIELDLDIPVGEELLQSLPWEMMMAGDEPLAALRDPKRRIAITRIVETPEPPPVRPIEVPLRVLFVVGRQMDEALRPGAEYLALLRQFNMAVPTAAGTSVGAALHTRLLLQATSETLSDAIDDFCPSVVHFVAHGRPGDQGAELLLTREEGGVLQADPVGADRLSRLLLGRTGKAPRVQAVLVNACHTADPDDSYVSFAAGLVMAGVPVAVGMSGEVADGVCRIFTRAFYQGLIEAKNLDTACAEGRRAAMLHYKQVVTSVEWVRPTLFRAARARPVFETNAGLKAHARAAALFRRRAPTQMLCDRMGAMQAFQDLCATARGGGAMGLAFEVTLPETALQPQPDGTVLQLGKTWLLNELASQAALEGFVPCLLQSGETFEVPANLLLLAIRLSEAMDDTREKFGRERRVESYALKLAFLALKCAVEFQKGDPLPYVWAADKAKDALRQPRPEGGEWAGQEAVEAAIRADLEALLNDVADGPRAAALILIDDLHRYEGVEIPLLTAVKTYGLGSQKAPAPLVFTYSTRLKCGPKILSQLKGREGEIRREHLTSFSKPFETILAYRQYFLSRQHALTSSREHRMQVQNALQVIDETEIKGVPSYLSNLDRSLMLLKALNILVPANDEEIMAAQMARDAGA